MTDHNDTIRTIAQQGSYRNSREINLGGITYTMREVLLAAPLIAALNLYVVGGTGEGKTQLANDLAGYFGNNSCYAEGRPDFELAELLKQMNLEKVREAKTDRELVELTENVQKALYYVDELNRCPPIVQNYFFNFFDGKLVHNGKALRLGKEGYSVGFASGNLGDGAYVGVEDSDRALKDRMHLIVKLDYPDFITTEEDDWHIFGGAKDPRAKLPDEGKDITPRIIELHKEFGQRGVPAVLQALGIYFHKGLDYLENTAKNSKRAVDMVWPNAEGIRADTDEAMIMPLSKRAILATIGLTEALTMIAESKGVREVDSVRLYLDALRLTVPYSGVLSPQFVQMQNGGDVYAAFDKVMTHIKEDVEAKKQDLEEAIAFAQFGERQETLLDRICTPGTVGKWAPVRRAIEHVADNPALDTETLAGIKEKYKKPDN